MIFKDKNNQQISLYITNHLNKTRIFEKGNSLYRVPPSFNIKVFKKIVLNINISSFIDEYIVAILEYSDIERIHFLFKIESSHELENTISVILISSLITTNTILPYQKVSIDKRFFIESSYPNILTEIKNEALLAKQLKEEMNQKNILRSLEKRENIIPLKTSLKIVKKKSS